MSQLLRNAISKILAALTGPSPTLAKARMESNSAFSHGLLPLVAVRSAGDVDRNHARTYR